LEDSRDDRIRPDRAGPLARLRRGPGRRVPPAAPLYPRFRVPAVVPDVPGPAPAPATPAPWPPGNEMSRKQRTGQAAM